jgi:small subunit ribosomal protein S3Ae
MAKSVLRKTWFEIVAPDIFDNETVADTPAEEADMVVGRQVKVDLKDLMPTSDKYYMDVYLQVTDVEGEKAQTRLAGHSTSSEYISKMISRRSNRLDYVDDIDMADGSTVRVKVVGTTIRKTQSAQISRLRKRIGELLDEVGDEYTVDEFMEAVFQDEIQQHITDEAKKIYPLRDLEIRKTEVQ